MRARKHPDKVKQLQQVAMLHVARQGRIVLADLLHAVKTQRSAQLLVGMLVFCILFWNVPLVSTLLYPLKLFVTMIHESCHVLIARITGAAINCMSISPDESGLTSTKGGSMPALVAAAGYSGTAIFGGLMIWLGKKPKKARGVLRTLGWILLSLTIFYGGGGFFSFISMLVISLGILYTSKKTSDKNCHLLLLLLAVITTIEAFIDFQILTSVALKSDIRTDAANLALITGVPRTIWTLFFGLFSLTVLFLSFWLSYRPSNARNSEKNSYEQVEQISDKDNENEEDDDGSAGEDEEDTGEIDDSQSLNIKSIDLRQKQPKRGS